MKPIKITNAIKSIKTNHGIVHFPAFFPDATCGFVKSVSSADLRNAKVDGVVVNIYHLLKNNLIEKISRKGGIHKYMNLNKPIISDSGGFQVMSLIHRHPELGKIEDEKITFMLDKKRVVLTPETCIQLQLKIKSDIVMCLDDCTEASLSQQEQKKAVDRTISWAKRCKNEFERLTKSMKTKTLIFAIEQGGEYKKLRKYCAQELLKIGFDGYRFSVLPVRKGYFNMKPNCDCLFCRNYSLKDLYDYFRHDRKKAERLATIHNLRLYSR